MSELENVDLYSQISKEDKQTTTKKNLKEVGKINQHVISGFLLATSDV